MTRVMISGGFDPIHEGHLDYIEGARHLGSVVIVALNSDEWLIRKKGYVFQTFEVRKRILTYMYGISCCVAVDDSDGSVCDAIRCHHPTIFANGGDRGPHNTLEVQLCNKMGIQLAWNVGGGKVSSSSDLVRNAALNLLKRI